MLVLGRNRSLGINFTLLFEPIMNTKQFSGVFTALATPMKGSEVAYADLEKLVAHQLNGGINGLVSVGTTGESPTLNKAEHIEVVRATVKAAGGKVPVYAGTGSNSVPMADTFSAVVIGICTS